jgi:hypothetical protein
MLPSWIALLPLDAGATVLSVLPRAKDQATREVLAQAVLERLDSCGAQVIEILQAGSVNEARPLLAAMLTLLPARRAELAAAAFLNPETLVVLESVPVLAADAATAARTLGPALSHQARAVRIAAAEALAVVSTGAERAGGFLIEAIASPRFAHADAAEQAIFHRALGKLGSNVGFMYLSSQLAQPAKKLFGRRQRVKQQLFAVEGLAEEGSPRSLRALDECSSTDRGFPKPVATACKAAAQRVRSRKHS